MITVNTTQYVNRENQTADGNRLYLDVPLSAKNLVRAVCSLEDEVDSGRLVAANIEYNRQHIVILPDRGSYWLHNGEPFIQ